MAVLSLVEVQDLSCDRGGRRIFRNLSFAVATGQAMTLEGPNGAGKTSVLRILAGLMGQAAGEVRIHAGAGYVVRGRALFRDFVSWRGDLEHLRARGTGAILFPYGIRHQHEIGRAHV